MVRAMCENSAKKKRAKDLMLGLDEAIDQLAVTSTLHCYCHVLTRVYGHVL